VGLKGKFLSWILEKFVRKKGLIGVNEEEVLSGQGWLQSSFVLL